ncbi:hypothetical protein H8S20_15345 [Clostridium sp. NSJ-6]|uniref:DUF3784 domain-containing protein n=1 Tax=Clostridium hominis TaxID=2763036 RepID=A0ABR7DFN6_9CLOT|nr:hypothetical protein [Clostridium hominis]MBC5630235.1 hypothetical protein [Clostridium hominis]
MWSIILLLALVGGVYLFGRYNSINEDEDEEKIVIRKNKDKDLIIKIILSFVTTVIIVVVFIGLFELLRFGQEQMGIVVATMIIFTMIFCTYTLVEEMRKFNKND